MSRVWAEILGDPPRLWAMDPGDMLRHLDDFPFLFRQAWSFDPGGLVSEVPQRILLGAMGGSAIAGELLAGLLAETSGRPLIPVRSYTWPVLKSGDFLVLCSYSGETEEILALFREALPTRLPMLTLSAGGHLEELAKERQLPHVGLLAGEGALPPRAALPDILGKLLAVLGTLGEDFRINIDKKETCELLADLGRQLAPGSPPPENPAMSLALALGERRPVFVALAPAYEAVALRLRSQFEENAKRCALSRSLPEMHHNSWIPWLGGDSPGTPVWLGEADAHPRVRLRRRLSEEALAARGLEALRIDARGGNLPSRMLTSLLLGDFLSVYHALMRGVDPTPTDVLDEMKRRLRKEGDPQWA